MSEMNITRDNFTSEVLEAKGKVLIDFWAGWCGPCKMLSPVVHEIAKEYAGTVKVGKVNVDQEMELAEQYGIASIPALLLFEDGKLIKHSVGFQPKADIVRMFL